jgi:hypothetical protein
MPWLWLCSGFERLFCTPVSGLLLLLLLQGIMGVIDGVVPTEFETDDDKKKRYGIGGKEGRCRSGSTDRGAPTEASHWHMAALAHVTAACAAFPNANTDACLRLN